MIYEFSLETKKQDMIDITRALYTAIERSQVTDGTAIIYCPHTTAAITINENADPDVVHDLLTAQNTFFPDLPQYRHIEGNSAAHLKSSLIGVSETILIEGASPVLGTWQSPYFCEFDGPRQRRFYIKIVSD